MFLGAWVPLMGPPEGKILAIDIVLDRDKPYLMTP